MQNLEENHEDKNHLFDIFITKIHQYYLEFGQIQIN